MQACRQTPDRGSAEDDQTGPIQLPASQDGGRGLAPRRSGRSDSAQQPAASSTRISTSQEPIRRRRSALLTKNFPAASGEGDQVVFQATHGAGIRSGPVEAAATTALGRVAQVPGVETVVSPYSPAGAAQISHDGTVAFARVTWDKVPSKVTDADASRLIKAAESADGPARARLAGWPVDLQSGERRPGTVGRGRRDRRFDHPADRVRRRAVRLTDAAGDRWSGAGDRHLGDRPADPRDGRRQRLDRSCGADRPRRRGRLRAVHHQPPPHWRSRPDCRTRTPPPRRSTPPDAPSCSPAAPSASRCWASSRSGSASSTGSRSPPRSPSR